MTDYLATRYRECVRPDRIEHGHRFAGEGARAASHEACFDLKLAHLPAQGYRFHIAAFNLLFKVVN